MAVNMNLTFVPGGTNQLCVNVTIVDDDILEDDETFTVDLTSQDPSFDFNNDRLVVTIPAGDGELRVCTAMLHAWALSFGGYM